MTRFVSLILVMCMTVGLAWAAKGGNGKPGGGGGTSLSGDFYVFLETPTHSIIAYGTADPVGSFALAADGSGSHEFTDLGNWPQFGEVSYDLHAGERVFLSAPDIAGKNPDGSSRNALVATLSDGTSVQLTASGSDLRILSGGSFNPAVRWAKGDSFVSFAAIVWDSAGVASTHIFEAPVSWDSAGEPALDLDPEAIVDGTISGGESSLDGHDWSPDGTQLVYEDGTAIKVVTFGATASTVTIAGAGEPRSPNGDPRWSPVSGSERIAYVDDWDIRVVDADGTDAALLATAQSSSSSARWSPDGNHIAFVRTKNIKIQGRANYTANVYVVSAQGGSASDATKDVSDRVGRFRAWR